MEKLISVYLAGKISKNDWRNDIFKFLSSAEWHGQDADKRKEVKKGNFKYCGPFFIACDHGCYHGEGSHGRGVGEWYPGSCLDDIKDFDIIEARRDVIQKCVGWINDADIVFAWIDQSNAYGTLVEIGIAHQGGKPIFLAMPIGFKSYKDMWFAWTLADYAIMVADHKQAWDIFEHIAVKMLKRK